MSSDIYSLPCVSLRDIVLFPHMITPVYVARGRALATIESLPPSANRLLVVAQRDPRDEEPAPEGLYRVGTEAEVLQVLRLSDGTIKVLLEGLGRCRVRDFYQDGDTFWAEVAPADAEPEESTELAGMCLGLMAKFEDYLRVNHRLPHELYAAVESMESASAVSDAVAANVPIKIPEKQRLLETFDPPERMTLLSSYLDREIELLKIERKVRARARRQMDRSQKEFYLTEQLKAIQRELGQTDGMMADGDELSRRASEMKLPKEVAEKVEKEVKRLEAMTPLSPEASVVRTYVEWLLDVPWKEKTRDRNNLDDAWDILESEHFGLKKIKERILEHLAVKILNKAFRGPILCFVGPPGVGKTSLGRSVANALGRKFVRVSLGGVRDEAEIRGHRRTYIGAMPGRIIQSMKKVGTRNPVFLLDEVDKMTADFRGDPSSALLEALDPEQNKNFNDHYLEVDYDLSRVFFITTANSTDAIPPPLLDRMEVIRLPGYTDEEKREIAKQFLVPKQRTEHGLGEKQIQFPDDTIMRLIHEYTRESGVRNLERELGSLCRKVARRFVEKRNRSPRAKKTVKGAKSPKARAAANDKVIRLKPDSLEKYLGAPRYTSERPEARAGVGVATGLAWTSVGGVLLPVEVGLFDGKGTVTLTGKLGEVMKESAQAAISWLRSRAGDLSISPDFYEKKDMHIHFPEAAVPKDGPSAGITMALALASALTGRKVRHDVAMSGEITLRGRILSVGGVKEKMLAARRGGIPKVIFPKGNEKDVREFEAESSLGLEILYVENMDEVVREGLLPAAKKKTVSVAKAASRNRRVGKAVGMTPKRRSPAVPKAPAASGKKRSGSVARRTGHSG